MSGIKNFDLVDFDSMEKENVIRHVCGRRYLGWKKVDALEDVLLDRNPNINIQKHYLDIIVDDGFETLVRAATVVALCTDNDSSRYKVNHLCISNRIPFVTARVFTRGIGGEVFSYRPAQSGCLACLETVLQRSQYRQGVREIDLVSEVEREKMYGMEIPEIKDSPGLNVDIAFIAAFHTRFILDAIASSLPERPKYMQPIDENYIVWGNRPTAPFSKHFQLQRITLAPQKECMECS
jgi:molybdopterin/thiamine biosynthesis adenylyltransferase